MKEISDPDELKRLMSSGKKKRANKYNAKPVTLDGIRFASTAEGARYVQLKQYEREKLIAGLVLQPRYTLAGGVQYVADFAYWRGPQMDYIVEDVKGRETAVFKIKKKLFRETRGFEITVITFNAKYANAIVAGYANRLQDKGRPGALRKAGRNQGANNAVGRGANKTRRPRVSPPHGARGRP